MQGKVCGKKRHTKTEIRSEISELICGRIAAGENYNLTRDNFMKHDGPYNQAASAKRALRLHMKEHPNTDVKKMVFRLKMLHAAWFFGMSKDDFEKLNSSGLPEDAIMDLTMFAEDLKDPTEAIERIFNINIPIDEECNLKTDIDSEEFQMLLESVFCPEFNLVPSPSTKSILIEEQMNQLLYEQYRLLDFLEDQNTAVINGAAGTGKTMLAVEKARRNSVEEEPVLFLCYNRLLCNNLNETHKKSPSKEHYEPIDVMVLDGESWTVTYEDSDYKKYTKSGDNEYPTNWKKFLKLLSEAVGRINIVV